MRPDAISFTPRDSTPTSLDGDTTLVQYDGDRTSDSIDAAIKKNLCAMLTDFSIAGGTDSPRDMIVHECIKRLVEEVAALKMRCGTLESTNAELKVAVEAIERVCAAKASTAAASGNLTECASSDSSSQAERGRSTEPKAVNQHMDMIEKILGVYKEKIETQGAQQQDLEKRLERKSQDQTVLKGRIGKLEKELKSLKDEYDGTSSHEKGGHFSYKASGTPSEVGAFFTDELQQVQLRLSNLEHQCGAAHNELEDKCGTLITVIEGSGYEMGGPTGLLNAAENNALKASSQDIVDLKHWQARKRRLDNNNQLIDDAPTRDALYAMFFQLSHVMEQDAGAAIWCQGPFEVTSDEAFALRDRVVRRLALFDLHTTAFQEVQSKKGHVDW